MTLVNEKLNEDFPHQEYPEGIIRIGISKASRVINLMKRYQEVGFKDFDLTDIATMSLAQWKRREYPIPKGYKATKNALFIKLRPEDMFNL